jgi:predicted nuclease with TOPRIM domain
MESTLEKLLDRWRKLSTEQAELNERSHKLRGEVDALLKQIAQARIDAAKPSA